MSEETRAVIERYSRRSAADDARRYSMLSAANWQTVHERQRAMLRLFRGLDLPNVRLVEVGSGSGTNLLELLRLGFARLEFDHHGFLPAHGPPEPSR